MDEGQLNFANSLIECIHSKDELATLRLRALLDLQVNEDGNAASFFSPTVLTLPIHEAVYSGNAAAVQLLLDKCQCSKGGMAKILNKRVLKHAGAPIEVAAGLVNVELLRVLLATGADPNTMIVHRNISVFAFVCGNYDGHDVREPLTGLDKIVQLFLDYGANVLQSSSYDFARYLRLADPDESMMSGITPEFKIIHLVGELAKRSPEASQKIIASTPPQYYNVPALVAVGTCGFGHIGSPLSIAVFHGLVEEAKHYDELFNHAYSDSTDDGELMDELAHEHLEAVAKRVFSGCVWPLFEAGGEIKPDPFTDQSFIHWRNLTIADELLFSKSWSLIDFIVLTRRRTDFNFKVLEYNLFQNCELLSNLSRRFRTIFPLSLQQMCRIAVLKYLPVGTNTRQTAVRGLPLPEDLLQFLLCLEFKL